MSAPDYMSRSGYGEDVYKFPVVDAEGKPITGSGRILGTRTYVIESYVEEVQRRRAVYPATSGTKPKESQPYSNIYGRPREVHDLLSKIMDEVNRSGPPPKTSDPNTGTYNLGSPRFPLEPPARASDPNLGRGRYSFPVNEGTMDNFGGDHGYGSSPAKVDPMGYGYDYSHGGSPIDQWGKSSNPVYDGPHQGRYGAPNHQWRDVGPRSSSPIYDRRTHKLPKTPSHGKPGSPKDQEVHKNGGGGSLVKSQTPYEYDVPRDSISAMNPKEYEIPDSQWRNPDVRDYGVPSNKWDKLSSPVHDYPPRENPQKQWGGSARQTGNLGEYGVPSNKWDKLSSPSYDHPQGYPENRLEGSTWKTHTPGEYGVPIKQWERSSSPIYDHPQNNLAGPKNQWVSPYSPKEYGVASNPKNQWGIPHVKTHSRSDYRVPDNQWERSSSPKYQRGSPPMKPHSPLDYGVSSDQLERSSSPKYQKGSPSVKPQSLGNYGVPSDQWERPSSPKYQKESPLVKPRSPGVYGVPSDQWEKPSSPKYQKESPLVKPQSPRVYGFPSDQWEKPSSPKYQNGSLPVKPQSPRVYGIPTNQWDTPSSPKYQRGSPLVKLQGPQDYEASSNQQGRSSSPIYDYPQNSSSKKQWGSSPLKPQSPRALMTNQWNKSPSAVYDHRANEGHKKPLEAICEDGVCTLSDKPKAPQGIHEYEYGVPKDNGIGFAITSKPISYPDDHYGNKEGWRSSNPRTPDHQPTKELGKSTNQKMPSGNYNNMGEALELDQLSLDSPRGTGPTGLQGSRKSAAAPSVWPIQEAGVVPSDVDSRGAVRRYGGPNFPEKPYAGGEDQNRTLTCREAIDKYNGSFVPQ